MNLIGISASLRLHGDGSFEWGILDKVLGFDHLGRLTMFPPVILFSILFGPLSNPTTRSFYSVGSRRSTRRGSTSSISSTVRNAVA